MIPFTAWVATITSTAATATIIWMAATATMSSTVMQATTFLVGGNGKDILKGGAGNDTYIYGDNDTIIDNQGINTLKFSDGLNNAKLNLKTIHNDDGSQSWEITSEQGSALIQNQIGADGSISIDRFQFNDQTYTAAQFQQTFQALKTETIKLVGTNDMIPCMAMQATMKSTAAMTAMIPFMATMAMTSCANTVQPITALSRIPTINFMVATAMTNSMPM